MIAIVDYGAGNLFSVKNALDFIGADNIITKEISDLENCDGIILPGVGAFGNAMKMLENSGLVSTIKELSRHKPLLGICLGMQLLFENGYEFGETDGMGLIKGKVDSIVAEGLNIPHMGWNRLKKLNDCPLMNGISDDAYVYFVHSFQAYCDEKNVSAFCEYGGNIPALVFSGNVYGAQFHPEKSGEVGLKILKNFITLTNKDGRN